jgi:hypothetical protein
MKKWHRFIRPVLFFVISVLLFFQIKDAPVWLPFLLLSVFYLGMDVYSIGKRKTRDKTENETLPENYSGSYGILGYYIVDSTKLYGLYMELLGTSVFIGIREDKFLEQRKQQAMRLFDAQKELEINLIDFIEKNPKYKNKKVSYIGLFVKNLEQGEVFWDFDSDPEDAEHYGYTLLHGLNFVFE